METEASLEGRVAAPFDGRVVAPFDGRVVVPFDGRVAAPFDGRFVEPALFDGRFEGEFPPVAGRVEALFRL